MQNTALPRRGLVSLAAPHTYCDLLKLAGGSDNRWHGLVRLPVVKDEARFREYVAGSTARLRRTAYLVCGDWHRAEDAVQAVLVTLYVKPPRDWSAVDAWVRTALLRRLIDESRKPWNRDRLVGAVPERAEPDGPDAAVRLEMLAALRSLPTMQRAVLVLRFWDDLSVAQTAQALRLGEGTVKSHTSRGLASLRTSLEQRTAP